ncbi:Nup93/Nic96-domain-containing protein, partial [Catenaria anguillulae PL171]
MSMSSMSSMSMFAPSTTATATATPGPAAAPKTASASPATTATAAATVSLSQSQSQSHARQMSFQELLQRSRQLNGVVFQAQAQTQTPHQPISAATASASVSASASALPASTSAALLHRSLNQVAERSLLLVERSANDPSVSLRSSLPFAAASQATNANLDATAQSFLASAGVNAHQLKRDLDSLDVSTTLEPVHTVADTDYTSYLNNEHDNLILSTMEQAKQKAAWDLDCLVAQANNADWEFSKRAFFTSLSLSLGTPAPAAAPGAPSTSDQARTFASADRFRNTAAPFSSSPSTFATTAASSSPTSPASHAATSAKSAAYLKALARSNESGFNSNIFADFRVASSGPLPSTPSTPNSPFASSINNQFTNPDTHHLAPLWDLLNALLSSSAPLSHATNYLASPAPPTHFLLDLFARSRKYLEANFFDMLEDTVQRNPAIARAGGDPSPIHRVAAYARARHGKAGLKWDIPHVELTATQQGDVPLWAVVYYLVRSGRTADAVEFLKNHQEAVLPADAHFYMYLASWGQGGVEDGSPLQRDLRNYYAGLVEQQQQSIEAAIGMSTAQRYGFGYAVDNAVDGTGNDIAVQGVDPFKMAIVKLVGRCDLSNKKTDRLVVPATEDWLWTRLVTIGSREYLPWDLQADVLPLESLFTQQHPAMFATVLATVGLFDHAVIHLLKAGNLVQDALHVALALMHVGCLRLPADPTDVLGMQVDASSTSSSSLPATLTKTVPIHTLIAQYLASPAMAGATSLEKLQYLARLPLYAVGTSSSPSPSPAPASSATAAWQAPFVHWRDYALDQLVPWAMAYPSGQALTIHPRLLAMLGLADMPAFHSLVTRRAAEVARAQDKLDVAVYLSAQALDPRSVFETLHAMLARAIVHGPSMLALGAAASVGSAAAATAQPFGASVSGAGANMQTVVQAADFVLSHFGGARSLNDFAADVAELRQLEGMRDVALLLRDVLNVKAVATESALIGATNSIMGSSAAAAGARAAARGVSPIDALNTLRELHLIPYGAGDLAACFERVKRLPVVAHGVVPVVLKLAMDLVLRVCCEEATAAAAGFGGGMQQQVGPARSRPARQWRKPSGSLRALCRLTWMQVFTRTWLQSWQSCRGI